MKQLNAIRDPLLAKEIEEKIGALFPENCFYFYNTKGENLDQEGDEIKRLILDCLSMEKCFIKKGNIEPIHHTAGERKIIVD